MKTYTSNPLIKCRVCGSKLNALDALNHMPVNGMETTKNIVEPSYCDYTLYVCKECSLYQITDINKFRYQTDFSSYTVVKTLMDCRNDAINYLSDIAKNHDNLFEIGCGTGKTAGLAKKHYNNVVSLDPDDLIKNCSQQNGHTLIYQNNKTQDKFDAFYILDVLAHVYNPLEVMKDVYDILSDTGVGFIEVPNGLTIMNESQYYSVFPEHLNYFTPHSLSILVKLAGFETILIRPSLGKDHLEIFFKKPTRGLSILEVKNNQFKEILKVVAKFSNIVIWGAGAKAHFIFAHLCEELRVSHIVDTMESKHGLYMPGASVPIELPSKSVFKGADLVIIFASSYEKEIRNSLKEWGYRGEIFSITSKIN